MQQRRNNRRKLGRPKLPKLTAKAKIVPVRLDGEDVKLVSAAASLSRQTLSEWIRDTIRAAAEKSIFGSTLHEAMRAVLLLKPNRVASMTEIADDIAKADLYRRKDGATPKKEQIAARARKYPHLFAVVAPQTIQLIGVSAQN